MTRRFAAIAQETDKARAALERAKLEAAAEAEPHPAVVAMNRHYAEWMADERNAQRMLFASTNMHRGAHAYAQFELLLDEALGLRKPKSQLATVPVFRE